MTGQPSPKIWQLSTLEEFYTWGTGMSGPLPEEVGQLAKLETASVHNYEDIRLDEGTWTVSATAAKDGKDSVYASFAGAFANYNNKSV